MTQTSPGRFAWTAPTGRLHTIEPEPYDPLPNPVPRSDDDHHDLPAMTFDPPPPPTPPPGSPRRNKHGYLTQAALDTAAHLRQRARDRACDPGPDPEPEADTQTATEPNPDDRFPEAPPF